MASVIPSVSIAVATDGSAREASKILSIDTEVTAHRDVDDKVIALLEAFARDCTAELDSRYAKVVTVRLCLKPKKPLGLISDDKVIAKIFSDNAAKYDKLAEGIPRRLEVECVVGVQAKYGMLTGVLRFPHMLKYLFEQLEKERSSDQTRVCIVGPGLSYDKNGVPSSPQFVELLALFPASRFLLLDYDERVLEACTKFFNKYKTAMYEPTMLMTRTRPGACPESYLKTFNALKQFFIAQAHKQDPKEMEAMLYRPEGKPRKFYVHVPSERVEVRPFDINTTQFPAAEVGTFDLIVATMSITNAFFDYQDQKSQPHVVATMVKFLDALKENGQLLIDNGLYHYVARRALPLIQAQVAYDVHVKELLYADFWPSAAQELFPQINVHTSESLAMNYPFRSVATSAIIILTRGAKKIAGP